jgi:phosphatidate cytidylyltransferase
MLKLRILTIVLLAPLAVAAILLLPHDIFACLILLGIAIGAYEWGRLSEFSGGFSALLLIALTLLLWHFEHTLYLQIWLYWIAFIWWCVALYLIVRFQRGYGGAPMNRYLKLFIGAVVLLPAWFAIVNLHGRPNIGPALTLYLFLIFWAADIGAYIAGKLFGRTRLASNVSPGKTFEGVAGALLAVFALAAGAAVYFGFAGSAMLTFILLSLFVAIVSIVGDLYESLMKRQAGVKDSGRLLPGHGGMLDRVDSLIAGAPVFMLGYGILLA